MLPTHRCYCEVFGGGAALLLSKPRSEVEVYNDVSDDLVGLFRCARFHRDELLAELELVLNSRVEFKAFAEQGGLTDIQRAARWFYRVSTCFGGESIGSFGVSKVCGGAAMGSRSGRLNKLAALSQRLDRVCIEHLDWRVCLDRYDAPDTVFFLDPPYTGCNTNMYDVWSVEEMGIFAERAQRLRARWICTTNDNAENRALFAGCQISSLKRVAGIENRQQFKRNKFYRELLICPARSPRRHNLRSRGRDWLPPNPPPESRPTTFFFGATLAL
jgi:DNA adenine methylase